MCTYAFVCIHIYVHVYVCMCMHVCMCSRRDFFGRSSTPMNSINATFRPSRASSGNTIHSKRKSGNLNTSTLGNTSTQSLRVRSHRDQGDLQHGPEVSYVNSLIRHVEE